MDTHRPQGESHSRKNEGGKEQEFFAFYNTEKSVWLKTYQLFILQISN